MSATQAEAVAQAATKSVSMTSKPLKAFDPLSLGERSTRQLRSTAIPQ